MKKSLSPATIILVLAIIVIIVGAIYIKYDSPAAKQKMFDDAIASTVAKGPPATPPADAKNAEPKR